MNWAIVAPETRLFKGKSLYRWELSPGVHHHCGTCATPLSNAHAKTTCLGKHVEPCYRFHQQLHFVGKAHECFGCNSSDEKHYQRHREILKIVRQINLLNEIGSPTLLGKSIEDSKHRRQSSITLRSTTDTGSESINIEDPKISRRERKRAKKAGNGVMREKHKVEAFPKEETDFVSEAIHLFIHESKGAWEGTYVYTQQRPETEEAIGKRQEDSGADESERFHERIENLAVRAPITMSPRQRKVVRKLSTPINHSSFGGGSRKFSGNRGTAELDQYNGVDSAIFFRLGIEVESPIKDSRARKELIAKLAKAIRDDLMIITREESESALREEGFWRWAGRNAYNSIVETRTELDWATGQKKGTTGRPTSFRDKWVESENFTETTDVKDSDCDLETPGADSLTPTGSWSNIDHRARNEAQLNGKTLGKPQMTVGSVSKGKDDGWTTVGSKVIPKKSERAKDSVKSMPNRAFTQEEEGEQFGDMLSRHQQRVAGDTNIVGGHSHVSNLDPARKAVQMLSIKIG